MLSDKEYITSSVNDDEKNTSDLESETLAEVETTTSVAVKNHKGYVAAKAARGAKKKKETAKGLSMECVCVRCVSFCSDKLLQLAKEFVKLSCNAKHSTNKKVDKHGEEISIWFEELVAMTNKLNESNLEFTPIESNQALSLHNCWQYNL
jgi:hypothetical protein